MSNSESSPDETEQSFRARVAELNETDEILRLTRNLLEELLSSSAVTLSVLQVRTVLLNERLNKHLNERIPF